MSERPSRELDAYSGRGSVGCCRRDFLSSGRRSLPMALPHTSGTPSYKSKARVNNHHGSRSQTGGQMRGESQRGMNS